LYGISQALRAWYNKIDSYFCQKKFDECPHEHTLFVKQENRGNDEVMFETFKSSMKRKFAITDLRKMR